MTLPEEMQGTSEEPRFTAAERLRSRVRPTDASLGMAIVLAPGGVASWSLAFSGILLEFLGFTGIRESRRG